MKKNIFLMIILSGLVFCSCDKFLDEASEDLIIPQTVSDYQELLQGDAYSKLETQNWYTDLLTDDVVEALSLSTGPDGVLGPGGDNRLSHKGYFSWQKEMELTIKGTYENDRAWGDLYNVVMLSNIALNDADGLDSKPEEIAFLKGEAHFLRAYSYFLLVNLYGKPYVKDGLNDHLGVPINLVAHLQDKLFSRATVADVYKQVEDDLNDAIAEFEKSGIESTKFHANADVCNFLLCRMYLYQKNWAKTIEFADKVLVNHSVLKDISGADVNNETPFYSRSNPEIIFSYGGDQLLRAYQSGNGFFAASESLANLYGPGDNRKKNYINSDGPGGGPGPGGPGPGEPVTTIYKINKTVDTKPDIFYKAFRISEIYLNRAEAYAESKDYGKAISDIKFLRSHRLSFDPVSLPADETLIQYVRDERRMELCFESHRWFDLRRWDQPRIEHKYSTFDNTGTVVGEETFVLEEKDDAYTLQLPFAVRQFNPAMKINNRPNRSASTN